MPSFNITRTLPRDVTTFLTQKPRPDCDQQHDSRKMVHRSSVNQLPDQIDRRQRSRVGQRGWIGATTVTTFSIFVVNHRMTLAAHLLDHSSGMTRMYPVILHVGPEEHFRILNAWLNVLVWRVCADELSRAGQVRVVVLGHPARASSPVMSSRKANSIFVDCLDWDTSHLSGFAECSAACTY